MDVSQLQNVIDKLSKVIEVSNDKKEELLTKYYSMSDIEVMKELAQISYRVLGNNEEQYNYALTVIRNINPQVCPPIEEMKVLLNRMYSNELEGNMPLEQNHRLVNESLVNFTTLFNQYGIDYYVVGALPCFIKTGQQLFRYHDDIDIMVNEEDIPVIAEIMQFSGYAFYDDRFPSLERYNEMQANKPPHTVLAQNPNNEFHLGFFCFRREKDGSITMREFSHRIENGEVVVDVLERKSDPTGTALRYDDISTEYLDTSFRTSTIESVYNLKSYTNRPKDITDMQKLEPFINKQRLMELIQHPNQNLVYENVDNLERSSQNR